MLSLNLNRFTTIYFISRILVPKVYQFTCVFLIIFFTLALLLSGVNMMNSNRKKYSLIKTTQKTY